MIGRSAQSGMLVLVLAMATMTGCRKEAKEPTLGEKHDEAQDRWAIDSARMEADRIAGAAPSELTGSAWQMVQLRTAHDSVIRPDEIGVFSVEFGSDGKALVIGGCNRGSGSYSLTPPSGLAFGPLATTRVMCRPESISSRFLGDFSRMEAYQLVGGHLYVRLAGP